MEAPIEILTVEEFKSVAAKVGVKFVSLTATSYVLADGRRFFLCCVRRRWVRCR